MRGCTLMNELDQCNLYPRVSFVRLTSQPSNLGRNYRLMVINKLNFSCLTYNNSLDLDGSKIKWSLCLENSCSNRINNEFLGYCLHTHDTSYTCSNFHCFFCRYCFHFIWIKFLYYPKKANFVPIQSADENPIWVDLFSYKIGCSASHLGTSFPWGCVRSMIIGNEQNQYQWMD